MDPLVGIVQMVELLLLVLVQAHYGDHGSSCELFTDGFMFA